MDAVFPESAKAMRVAAGLDTVEFPGKRSIVCCILIESINHGAFRDRPLNVAWLRETDRKIDPSVLGDDRCLASDRKLKWMWDNFWMFLLIDLCNENQGFDELVESLRLHRESRSEIPGDVEFIARMLDDMGEPTEKIADKETFHHLDAGRYVISRLRGDMGLSFSIGDEEDD